MFDEEGTDRKIIYPRFAELAHLTSDKFWKDFLMNCATNKKIKHLNIQGENGENVVTFDDRYKKTITKLPENNEEALKIFQNLMKSELNILSSSDVKKQQERFADLHQNHKIEINKWKQISKQRMKDNLIMNYCLRLGEEHNLTFSQVKNLFQSIKYALVYKYLKNTDIEIDDSKISHINGIRFNEKTKTFDLTLNDTSLEKCNSWTGKKVKKISEEMNNYYKQRGKLIKT